MAKKRKRGRPKLPKGKVRHVFVKMRMTHEERRELKRVAREKGQTVSEWIRGKVRAVEA